MNAREEYIMGKSVEILTRELDPKRIYLFGSRAKGEERSGSDFDFALDCQPPERMKIREVKEMLDAVAGLYSIDIVFLQEINLKLKELILMAAKLLYEKK